VYVSRLKYFGLLALLLSVVGVGRDLSLAVFADSPGLLVLVGPGTRVVVIEVAPALLLEAARVGPVVWLVPIADSSILLLDAVAACPIARLVVVGALLDMAGSALAPHLAVFMFFCWRRCRAAFSRTISRV
jgi:hypothetical protein